MTVVKVPQNVLVDPVRIPGVYLVRIVATLERNMGSSSASALPPYMVQKEISLHW